MSDQPDNHLLDGELLPLKEAAEYAGLTRDTLNNYVQRGRIKARKLGSQWVTTRASIDAYVASRQNKNIPHKYRKDRPLPLVTQTTAEELLSIGELVTMAEAAEHAELAQNSLVMYAHRGVLAAVKRERRWMTTHAAVDAYLRGWRPEKRAVRDEEETPLGDGDWISLAEAAVYAGLNKRTIHGYAFEGKIQAVKFGGQWYTTREAIDDYLDSRRPRKSKDESINLP